MKRLDFFSESLRNLKEVGTVTRSSRYLCRNVANQIAFDYADVIVELGAGDGVITREILKRMKPEGKLIVLEINEVLAEDLHKIKDPRFSYYQRSAEELTAILSENKIDKVDYVVSALPFTVMPKEVTKNIVVQCKNCLRLNGKFIQVHYSLVKKGFYKMIFGNVKVNFVFKNLPPAFILVSELREED
nr:methyltransferase domain-containing protein [Saprospiraceae bacterium]